MAQLIFSLENQKGIYANINGSCMCGGIHYEVIGGIKSIRNCHCKIRRKAHSAAFRARAVIKINNLKWLSGEPLLTFYESSPGKQRGFCIVCGSSIITKYASDKGIYSISVGTFDTDLDITPESHIFVSEKASWYEINDQQPQYDQFPENT